MIKRNKVKLIISSIIILLPTLIAIFGNKFLPEKIAIHWGFGGNADGFASPSFIFILFPIILLAIHWICILVEAVVSKNSQQNKKLMELTFWIIPTISLAASGMIVSAALGHTKNIFPVACLLLSVAFIVIGNYMPKATRNKTMGIKIKWAMSNDENWNATHRFGGKVFMISGFIFLLAMPFPPTAFPFVAISVILISALAPTIYSYVFYKKQLREGKATKEDYEKGFKEIINPNDKKIAVVISVILTVLLVVFLPLLMFTGKINATIDNTSIKVEASFSGDLTVKLEDIDTVEYRENSVPGTRVVGFGSARLLLGSFENDEFGLYTRYTYTGKKPCIVMKSGDNTIVIGLESAEETKALYEEIFARIAE